MEAVQSFKRSENYYLVTLHNIPEDLCLHCPPFFFIHTYLYKNVLKHTWAFQLLHSTHNNSFSLLYRGADKSLARPGRKKATVTEDFYFGVSYL